MALTLIKPKVSGSGRWKFEQLTGDAGVTPGPLQTFLARDGTTISDAHYPADGQLVLILLHGSGYHARIWRRSPAPLPK